jgi:hypothetical protein
MQTVRVPSSSSDVAKQSVIIDYDDKVGVRLPGGIELVWQKATTTKQELLVKTHDWTIIREGKL